MTRGLRETQRAILTYLEGDPSGHDEDGVPRATPIDLIAVAFFGTANPTQPQMIAIQRAVRGLAAASHVTASSLSDDFDHSRGAEVRRVLTIDEVGVGAEHG